MFEFVRKHTRLLQFVLVLLIFPSFVLFGIQGYSRLTDGAQDGVVKVDGHKITQAEWDAAHRQQLERARRQMPNLDASLFDSPEMRRATLDGLVRERVMLAAASHLHLSVTDQRLLRLMTEDPDLASVRNADGTIDRERYLQALASAGIDAASYESKYAVGQVTAGIQQSALAPVSATESALDALFQQREIQVQRFDTKDYLAKVKPSDADIEAYYKDPAHAAQFRTAEEAKIEYLVLDLASVMKTITVPEEDLRKYYEENAARYTTPEERRASHILIKADKGAPEAERAKARAKAEALLPEAKKSAAAFADLAKKNSQDPGSAEKGGDLDFFSRGAMVKPFEDTVYALKPGETSGVVETDFGFHIIRLTEVRGGGKKSFDAVRAEIEQEAKKQQAQKRYAEEAEQFTNTVYEQSDSLKPAADKLKLDIKTATVQRQPTPDTPPALANAKLLTAIFANDVLRDKRNTEAVETGPSQMVAARVVQYLPSRTQALDEVKPRVLEALIKLRATELARKEGEEKLAAGRKDAATALAGAPLTLSRASPHDQPPPVIDAVLKADAAKLPAWVGVSLGDDGYLVARINKILPRDPVTADPKRAQSQYGQAWTNAEIQAYYEALKQRYKVQYSDKVAKLADTAASSAAQ